MKHFAANPVILKPQARVNLHWNATSAIPVIVDHHMSLSFIAACGTTVIADL
jgi:hypothetical protein